MYAVDILLNLLSKIKSLILMLKYILSLLKYINYRITIFKYLLLYTIHNLLQMGVNIFFFKMILSFVCQQKVVRGAQPFLWRLD